jgi:hypothetical protein
MNFNRPDSEKSEKSNKFLKGKDNMKYYKNPKGSNFNTTTENTPNMSVADFDIENESFDKSSQYQYRESFLQPIKNDKAKANYSVKIKQPYSSKIGYVKEGFTKYKGINPVARYNFIIERYNEEINRYKGIFLRKIPFTKFLHKVYDFHAFYSRLTMGLILIFLSALHRRHKRIRTPYTIFFQYYNVSSQIEFESHGNVHWIFIILSLILLCLNIIFVLLFYFVIMVHLLVFMVISIYAYYYYRKNMLIIEENLFRNMVFDEEIDKTHKLNDYIVVNPGGTSEFLGTPLYTFLLFLYRKRDTSVPQMFMTYGNSFKREIKIIPLNMVIQIILFSVVTVAGTLFYFRSEIFV